MLPVGAILGVVGRKAAATGAKQIIGSTARKAAKKAAKKAVVESMKAEGKEGMKAAAKATVKKESKKKSKKAVAKIVKKGGKTKDAVKKTNLGDKAVKTEKYKKEVDKNVISKAKEMTVDSVKDTSKAKSKSDNLKDIVKDTDKTDSLGKSEKREYRKMANDAKAKYKDSKKKTVKNIGKVALNAATSPAAGVVGGVQVLDALTSKQKDEEERLRRGY